MQDFEKLGVFYLGKSFDPETRQLLPDDLLLYDSQDLTTHAVCVGMTGSGKTGLCLTLLEEAAIDGIPAIAIDPKGDVGNLLLTFPELRPADFRPWIDAQAAARAGATPDAYAADVAETWRTGLAEWGQDAARIARLRKAADLAIYTPGSNAGLPLTVLRSFSVPDPATLQNTELLRERITTAASGLLALLGIDADPLRSREHILLSNLFNNAWQAGRDLELETLIREISTPPFDQIGVLDLESFFPAKERFDLSLRLNNLLASPGFSTWLQGEPLDIQRLLYTADGRPRVAVISIAHLSDAERMFFVTILLNEMLAWMRRQSGTSSLRALLYMDEIFGFFPPTANPPSKTPMLTLLKQARAFGLGVVLATQNPVDLDYKGLSNAGTWFLGRLQTERDKARVLDGLEGASAAAGNRFDRGRMDALLSGLGKRVFVMNNVHDDEPVVFQTRWTLSYLCGPLTRDQIQTLTDPRRTPAAPAASAAGAAVPKSPMAAVSRPMLPPGVTEFFIPLRRSIPAGAALQYHPALLASAKVHFSQSSSGVDVWETLNGLAALEDEPTDSIWETVTFATDDPPDLESEPEEEAAFTTLPAGLLNPKKYADLATALKNALYRTHRLQLWKCASLKQFSQPGETEGQFRVRLGQAAHEQRDIEVAKLRTKYAPKLAALHEQIRKAEQRVTKEKSQATQQTYQAAISFGSSILGAICGRKLASSANVGRAATSARAAGRVLRERGDVEQAAETVEALGQRLADLEAQFQQETAQVQESLNSDRLELEELELQPKKADISVSRVVLVWTPWLVNAAGVAAPAS